MPSKYQRNANDNQANVEHAPRVGEGVSFLISDGGEGRYHHVETIEPGPTLDEVKAGGADKSEGKQRHADESHIAQGFHGGRWSLARAPRWCHLRPERASVVEGPAGFANDQWPTTNDYFPGFCGRACTLLCLRP